MNKVYFTDTSFFSNADVFNHYYQTVSEYRKAKIDKLKLKGKQNSLAVELLLQKALTDYGVDENTDDRIIAAGENGKPYLLNHPEIHFNLSHSGFRAFCIIGERSCGCDVEAVNEKRFNMNLVKRFFSKEEYDLLNSFDDPKKQIDLFFDLWTRKEAFIKMTGEGINYIIKSKTDFSDLNAFEEKNQCKFKIFSNDDEYKYTCCSKDGDFEEKMKFIKF